MVFSLPSAVKHHHGGHLNASLLANFSADFTGDGVNEMAPDVVGGRRTPESVQHSLLRLENLLRQANSKGKAPSSSSSSSSSSENFAGSSMDGRERKATWWL